MPGGRAGVVVETLAFHHCGLGVIPRIAMLLDHKWQFISDLAGFLRALCFPPSSKIVFLSTVAFLWYLDHDYKILKI